MMHDDGVPRHNEVEGRLAALASRLVLDFGVRTAQQELLQAAGQAERAFAHIAALSGGVWIASEAPPVSAALFGRGERRAYALARKLRRHTASHASSAEESDDALWPYCRGDQATVADVAAQLFMLLVLTRTGSDSSVPEPSGATGRELLALLLPHAHQVRYLGVQKPTARLGRYPVALLLYSVAIAVYLLLRFRGRYVEQDTAQMTQLVAAVAAYGSAIPGSDAVRPLYPFGFGFQAVNLYLMRLSGTSVQELQAWVWPFLLVAIALLTLIAFREMTGDPRVAALGGLFLFLQPDFLFTALRGSHEKMTYCLLFAALFLLFRSYRYRDDLPAFAGYVLLFYLTLLGVICTNSFFGSSLIAALTLSFFGGVALCRLLEHRAGTSGRGFVRLAYMSLSALLFLLVEVFYLYQPSSDIFDQFQSMLERLAGFLLGFGANANPYAAVSLDWPSPAIYLLLNSFTWLTVAVSSVAWCLQARDFVRGGWATASDAVRLRWLLYAGFAFQVGIGVIIDFAGVLGANLQLRLFPVYMLVAIPTSSAAVMAAYDRLRRPKLRQTLRLGMATVVLACVPFSLLKATNEPLLSNKWTFYSGAEGQTIDWLAGAVPQEAIWSDVDERLREAYLFRSPPTQDAAYRYPTLLSPEQARVVMLSAITRARMVRVAAPLPDVAQMNEIYDNGQVQVYKRLPQTPLQR